MPTASSTRSPWYRRGRRHRLGHRRAAGRRGRLGLGLRCLRVRGGHRRRSDRWPAESSFDLGDPAACTAAITSIAEQTGRIDVLINNAGINRRGPLLELDPTDWSLSYAVNVDALFHLCRAALPIMIAAGGGSIINTASQWGLHPAPGHIAYNTSKAAVVAFTQSLARDYGPHGVRVNAVCPGEVRTPMLESNLARSGRTLDDLNRLVPYGRIGEPEEIAALVAFLASDEAPYLAGSCRGDHRRPGRRMRSELNRQGTTPLNPR